MAKKISELTAATALDGTELIPLVQGGVTKRGTGNLVTNFSHSNTYSSGTLGKKAKDSVSVRDAPFNAAGDGSTDDSAAFIAALAVSNVVEVPWTSAGYNLGSTTITVGPGKHLIGDGLPILKSTASTCIALTGYDARSRVEGLAFDMTGASAGSSAIRFRTDLGVVWRVLLRNLRFANCVGAITDVVGGTYIVDVTIEDIQCTYPRGTQIYLSKSRGFMPLRDIFVDCTLSATPLVTWTSVRLEDYIGIELSRVDVVGQNAITTQVYDANAIGIYLNGNSPNNDRFVWLHRVRVESSMGPGIQILNTQFLFAHWLESFAALGTNIYLELVNYIQGSNWYSRGTTDYPGEVAGAHGVALVSCTQATIANLGADLHTGDGLLLHNTTDCQISNVRSWSNDGWGIHETGTSDRNTLPSSSLQGNVTGGRALVGGHTLSSGSVVANIRQPDTTACAFSAHKNGTDQTGILSATFTKITFGTELLDAGSHYDAANSKWTPPAGNYKISATINVTANVVDQAEMTVLIYKNGVAAAFNTARPSGTGNISIPISRIVSANGTDYFEIYAYLAGAGDKTISGAITTTEFSGHPV